MRGSLQPGQPWDVVVDLFFYREPEETKDEAEEGAAPDAFGGVPDAYGAQGLPAPPGDTPSSVLEHVCLSAFRGDLVGVLPVYCVIS